MLAVHRSQHTVAALGAEPNAETPLSARSAMICIVTLSTLGWAVVLLPLWAAIH
jgi:hypothetical protein